MFLSTIAGWATSTPVTSPNTISTPNLPTSTPVHQAYCSKPTQTSAGTGIPSETSLTSGSLLNGSSNQLAKAEEKIQGRGMSRSHASYGIQQLLQEQVRRWTLIRGSALFYGKWTLRLESVQLLPKIPLIEKVLRTCTKLSLYVNFSHTMWKTKAACLCIGILSNSNMNFY